MVGFPRDKDAVDKVQGKAKGDDDSPATSPGTESKDDGKVGGEADGGSLASSNKDGLDDGLKVGSPRDRDDVVDKVQGKAKRGDDGSLVASRSSAAASAVSMPQVSAFGKTEVPLAAGKVPVVLDDNAVGVVPIAAYPPMRPPCPAYPRVPAPLAAAAVEDVDDLNADVASVKTEVDSPDGAKLKDDSSTGEEGMEEDRKLPAREAEVVKEHSPSSNDVASVKTEVCSPDGGADSTPGNEVAETPGALTSPEVMEHMQADYKFESPKAAVQRVTGNASKGKKETCVVSFCLLLCFCWAHHPVACFDST